MKIDNNRNVIPLETARTDKKSAASETQKAAKSSSDNDQVDSRLSNALDKAVEGIEKSGLTAGQVHSQVDEVKASALLRASDIQASRPKVSDDEILKLADRVAEQSRSSPEQAAGAFNEFNASRVVELVQG